jgi:hypothetical protein
MRVGINGMKPGRYNRCAPGTRSKDAKTGCWEVEGEVLQVEVEVGNDLALALVPSTST